MRQLHQLARGLLDEAFGRRLFAAGGAQERRCPCCGWQGRLFRPYFTRGYTSLDAVCPQCASHARHRGHLLYYREHIRLFEQRGRLLYFAPELGILPHLKAAHGLVVETSDYEEIPNVDHRYDIMHLPVAEATFDFIICHRVIEHVSNDRGAMRELYRVLKPGGLAVISVPITRSRRATVEFAQPNPFRDLHYYDYGTDFVDRIPPEFSLRERRFSDLFDKQTFRRLALVEDSIFECRKPA